MKLIPRFFSHLCRKWRQTMISTILLFGYLFPVSYAGPPEGMVRQMIPFPAMCLPATVEKHHFAALMKELISDYGVHISLSFSASQDQSRRVVIIENPHSGLAGVLMITDERSCIAFSGEDRASFIRPPGHPVGTENEAPKT